MQRTFITNQRTSQRMRNIKSCNTSIEKKMAKLLHDCGLHYRSQPKIFGKPDFRIVNSKILIFCDSSFWHGRRKNELTGKAFSRNKKLWVEKLKRNKERAVKVNKHLRNRGWIVLRFWDDEINKQPKKVTEQILNAKNNKK